LNNMARIFIALPIFILMGDHESWRFLCGGRIVVYQATTIIESSGASRPQ
jgi:hypothetical protein